MSCHYMFVVVTQLILLEKVAVISDVKFLRKNLRNELSSVTQKVNKES